jgi:hypothetical protein
MQAPDQDPETLEFSAVGILPCAISEDLDGEFFGPDKARDQRIIMLTSIGKIG